MFSRPSQRRDVAVRGSKAWRRKTGAAPWARGPPNFYSTRWCGAKQRQYSYNSLYSCAQRFCRRLFVEIGSLPDHTAPDAARTSPGCPFAIDDPTSGQTVGRHFHVYVVFNDRTDPVKAHFPCRVSDDPMPIIECHAEASVGRDLVDLALHCLELFFRQTSSLRTNNRPRTGVSRHGAMRIEKEEVGRRGGYQIPSQKTISYFLYRAMFKKLQAITPTGLRHPLLLRGLFF